MAAAVPATNTATLVRDTLRDPDHIRVAERFLSESKTADARVICSVTLFLFDLNEVSESIAATSFKALIGAMREVISFTTAAYLQLWFTQFVTGGYVNLSIVPEGVEAANGGADAAWTSIKAYCRQCTTVLNMMFTYCDKEVVEVIKKQCKINAVFGGPSWIYHPALFEKLTGDLIPNTAELERAQYISTAFFIRRTILASEKQKSNKAFQRNKTDPLQKASFARSCAKLLTLEDGRVIGVSPQELDNIKHMCARVVGVSIYDRVAQEFGASD